MVIEHRRESCDWAGWLAYTGTVEPPLADISARRTPLLRTTMLSSKLVISIQFDLCNQDASQLRTVLGPKGVLNREILL
jgi:hypothetical protein